MSERPDPMAWVQRAASKVRDPETGRSAWLSGRVRLARWVGEDTLAFDVLVPESMEDAVRRGLRDALLAALREEGFDGVAQARLVVPTQPTPAPRSGAPVKGMDGPGLAPHGGPIQRMALPGVTHIVAVASGKGGVGKSTVSTNLAVGLRRMGWRTGLLDADIHGPSLPTMMGTTQRPLVTEDKQAVPVSAYGVRCLSLGLVADPGEAVIWRGPMVMGLLRQFLQQTAWGELDVLVVDLPPGTGDAQLTLIQGVELTGAVVVTTPQKVALDDAIRGLKMFRQLEVPLLGVVENMAWYTLPDGTRDPVFGSEGGANVAAREGVPLLAQVPLQTRIRRSGDEGLPAVLGDDEAAKAFQAMCEGVAKALDLAPPGADQRNDTGGDANPRHN